MHSGITHSAASMKIKTRGQFLLSGCSFCAYHLTRVTGTTTTTTKSLHDSLWMFVLQSLLETSCSGSCVLSFQSDPSAVKRAGLPSAIIWAGFLPPGCTVAQWLALQPHREKVTGLNTSLYLTVTASGGFTDSIGFVELGRLAQTVWSQTARGEWFSCVLQILKIAVSDDLILITVLFTF